MNKTYKSLFIGLPFLLFFSLFITTCKKDKSPTAPGGELPTFEQTGNIGETGGIIKITDESSPLNGVFVEIPSGALNSKTTITIDSVKTSYFFEGDSTNLFVSLEPSGLIFETPVEIGIPYSNISDPSELKIYYYNEEELIWESLPIVEIDIDNKMIIAKANHFTVFTIGNSEFEFDINLYKKDNKISAHVKLLTPLNKFPTNIITYSQYGKGNIQEQLNRVPFETKAYYKVTLMLNKGGFDSELETKIIIWGVNTKYQGGVRFEVKANNSLGGELLHYTDKLYLSLDEVEQYYSAEPLLFEFDDTNIDSDKEYYVKVRLYHINSDGYYLGPQGYYKTTKSESKKLSDLGSPPDENGNGLIDKYDYTTEPTVTTNDASNIDISSAKLNGNVTSDGGANITQRGFYWSKSDSTPDSGDNKETVSGTTGNFNKTINSLDPNTTYHFVAFATNSEGTEVGDVKSFTTIDNSTTPSVTTNSATDVTYSSAKLNGNVTSDGGANITQRGFYWSKSDSTPDSGDNKETVSGTTGNFNKTINSLDPNTTYHFVAFATNSEGTEVGDVDNFITSNVPNTTTPTASFTVSPTSGTTATTFNFDASGSSDNEDATSELQVRWDWENDGTYDTNYSTSKTTTHQYAAEGTKTIKLEVKDTGSLVGTTTKSVNVSNGGTFTGTVTDIDGNVYNTIQIGNQLWMAENLKVTQYRDGTPIPNITSNTDWINLTTGAYCSYDNNDSNIGTYGLLYNWYAVDDSRGLAPEGWHIPSDEEWKELEMYLGMSQTDANSVGWRGTDEGGKLKEAGFTHWDSPNTGATNSSGFTALPGGYRTSAFGTVGRYASFWTVTLYNSNHAGLGAWGHRLGYDSSGVASYYYLGRPSGFSVRCVRD